jgi:hypothetical protein
MAEATSEEDKTPNYTDEMVQTVISMYTDLGNDGLDEIADTIGKNVRSIRSKLVREGVYVATPKQATRKVDGPSKKELLRDIESNGFDVAGFEGATKAALTRLLGAVAN